jgi:hypothetical protein
VHDHQQKHGGAGDLMDGITQPPVGKTDQQQAGGYEVKRQP